MESWTPIGQTSNQLILYHPPSHALSVQPHPEPEAGPSRFRQRPLLLPASSDDFSRGFTPDAPTETISREGICPYCSQPLPIPTNPETSGTRNIGIIPYFQILERAHEGSRPPSPRFREASLSGSSTPLRERDRDRDKAGDLPGKGYYERFFREEGKLGMGAEGSVFLATHYIEGNVLGTYAVKKIAVGSSKEYLTRMLREVRLLETLRHVNIIPYHHSWIEPTRFSSFGPPINALHVLMMYATAGNLDSFLLTRSYDPNHSGVVKEAGDVADGESLGRLPKEERIKAFKKRRASGLTGKREENRGVMFLGLEEIMKLFSDIVEGLAFLHSNSILHLDLKCSNVLLHWEEGNLIPRAMISDFGTSEEMLLGKRQRTGHTGTMEYMAPETVVMDKSGQWRPSDSHADMWSLGMILHKLLFLHLPYKDTEDFDQLHEEIIRYLGFIPSPELIQACERRHIPRDLLLLLSKLVHVIPETRPSAEKVKIGLRTLQNKFLSTRSDRSASGGMVARISRNVSDFGNLVRGRSGKIVPVDPSNRLLPIESSPVRSVLALPSPPINSENNSPHTLGTFDSKINPHVISGSFVKSGPISELSSNSPDKAATTTSASTTSSSLSSSSLRYNQKRHMDFHHLFSKAKSAITRVTYDHIGQIKGLIFIIQICSIHPAFGFQMIEVKENHENRGIQKVEFLILLFCAVDGLRAEQIFRYSCKLGLFLILSLLHGSGHYT